MKIIICGAGQVGHSIASYLAEENNHVTIVDQDSALISRVNEELDVNTVLGHASNPDTLNQANAKEADLLIAVTRSDEVNMMACQVGHSLFGIPKKIARIRHPSYLRPEWSNLFSRTHMPIDVIISPENIIAEDICNRLSVPGTTYATQCGEDHGFLIGVICDENSPVINTPLAQVEALFPDLNFRIIAALRKGSYHVPRDDYYIEPGDEFFVILQKEHLNRVLDAFGVRYPKSRRIIIAGGGHIGRELVSLLQQREGGEHIKVIESDEARADYLSEHLSGIVVLNGSALEKEILQQAAVAKTDTYIATTNHDETNILSSLLAKQYGANRSITLVTNNAYSPLVGPLGVDCMVSPRDLLVAAVMRHIRRGRIEHIHSLRHGLPELIEARVSESAQIANSNICDLDLPRDVVIAAIVRDGEFMTAIRDQLIEVGDVVLLLAPQEHAHLVEKLFSIHVDIF